MTINFDVITTKSQDYLQHQIDELRTSCEKDPRVAEFVKYILAFSDEMAYASRGSEEAQIGRQIIQHIWQICGIDLSSMGNSVHFKPSWASDLNFFIGNYVYDDSGFDYEIDNFNGTVDFVPANDNGLFLQNPMIIVEAAKANHAYYKMMDGADVFTRLRGVKADVTKVLELVK